MVPTSDSGEGAGWVVEPPPVDGVIIHLDADTSELTPELREALEALARTLEESNQLQEGEEVEGFARRCPKRTSCSPLTNTPCYAKTVSDCRIVACPRAT